MDLEVHLTICALKLLIGRVGYRFDIHLDRLQGDISDCPRSSVYEDRDLAYLAQVIKVTIRIRNLHTFPGIVGGLISNFGPIKQTVILAIQCLMTLKGYQLYYIRTELI